MTNQPEALRLADLIDEGDISSSTQDGAAAELRRLYEVNQELVEALERLMVAAHRMGHSSLTNPIYQAEAALAKARGNT